MNKNGIRFSFVLVILLLLMNVSVNAIGPSPLSDDGSGGFGASKILSVTLYPQTSDYFCGPACIQTIVKLNGLNPTTQYNIGVAIGTDMHSGGVGSDAQNMATYLRNNTSKSYYRYSITNSTAFYNTVKNNINNNKGIIYNIDLAYTPNSNSHTGHYVVEYGYSNGSLYICDPFPVNQGSRYTMNYVSVYNAIDAQNDHYIA